LQLDIIVNRLAREFGVEADVGRVQIAYKETVTRPADGDKRFVKRTEGGGEFAYVKVRVRPGPAGSGYQFQNAIVGGAIAPQFIKPIDDGIREALARGVLAGHPIDDVHVELYDGAHHDRDSTEMAFKIAGSLAFQDAAKKARPVVVEPVMRVVVLSPPEYGAPIADDAARRRGRIDRKEERGGVLELSALVPLAEMLGYQVALRGFTRGRGSYSMRFACYEPRAADPLVGDDDRSAPITSPRSPSRPHLTSSIALPEPEDDGQRPG
jgi:elongation factor G